MSSRAAKSMYLFSLALRGTRARILLRWLQVRRGSATRKDSFDYRHSERIEESASFIVDGIRARIASSSFKKRWTDSSQRQAGRRCYIRPSFFSLLMISKSLMRGSFALASKAAISSAFSEMDSRIAPLINSDTERDVSTAFNRSAL